MSLTPLPPPLLAALEKIKPEPNVLTPAQVQQLINDDSRRTLCDTDFFYHLNNVAAELSAKNITGDFAEVGVWRGGAAAFMRELMAFYKLQGNLWLADVFSKYNPANRYGHVKDKATIALFSSLTGNVLPGIKEVQQFLEQFGNTANQNKFLEGSIFDTLPNSSIEKLSLLHIDVDFYEPTLFALEQLYPKLVPGGYVIIDDYGADVFNCKEAVDDFRSKNSISNPMVKMGAYPVAWQK